ncbi:hypothetical protein NFI96_032704, partial [Prochilodus magdalenae]
EFGATPVTQQCTAETRILNGKQITVVDTPGLTATMDSTHESKEELLQCLQLSTPGPHIFLLVIPLGRFIQEERDTVEKVVEVFGSRVYEFTIILFTFKDSLKDTSIENYVRSAGEILQHLVRKCGSRYHVFNNNNPGEKDQAAKEEYIWEALANGFIQPSTSPAGAGFFFVGKKDGTLGPCIDYRGLNAITVKDRYPLLTLQQVAIFTKLDLCSASNLIRIRQGDEWKMAFITPSGHYENQMMPFVDEWSRQLPAVH